VGPREIKGGERITDRKKEGKNLERKYMLAEEAMLP
jgi:hypothetical protein